MKLNNIILYNTSKSTTYMYLRILYHGLSDAKINKIFTIINNCIKYLLTKYQQRD